MTPGRGGELGRWPPLSSGYVDNFSHGGLQGESGVNPSEVKERVGLLCPFHSPFSTNVSVPLWFKNSPGQVRILTRFHTVLPPNVIKITFVFASVLSIL